MDMKDLYWLAGLLEGEGSFIASKPYVNQPPQARITLCSSDKDVVERAAKILGAKSVLRNTSSNRLGLKMQWKATVYSSRATGWMMTLYSLMGARRREQIRTSLAARRGYPTSAKHLSRTWRAQGSSTA